MTPDYTRLYNADEDRPRPSDVYALVSRAARLPWTRDLHPLIIAARDGDGLAMERLSERVERAP